MQNKKNLLFVLAAIILSVTLIQPVEAGGDGKTSVMVRGHLFVSAVIADNTYIIVGDRGKIFRSDNALQAWKAIESKTKNALVSICFPDDQHGWITGQKGIILHSKDSGRTWNMQSSGVNNYLLAVNFFNKNTGCAVGTASTVLITTDGGKTWVKSHFTLSAGPEGDVYDIESYNLYAVAVMDEQKICIAGDGGRIFMTNDAGKTWIDAKSPLYDEEMMEGKVLFSISYDSDTLYAVGIDSIFIYSKDQGKTWINADTGFSEPELYWIDMIKGIGMAVGSGGHIIRTSDSGLTWHRVDVPEKITRSALNGIDLKKSRSGAITGLIVGQNGSVGHLTNGKITWK